MLRPLKTKGSHRTIRLDAGMVGALEKHRAAQIIEKDNAADAYQDLDLVFADALGGMLVPQTLTNQFRRHREAAGIRAGRLHDLRHTSASHLLASGVPVHVVSARLGHSSPTVTYTVYSHLLERSDEAAADVMGDLLL